MLWTLSATRATLLIIAERLLAGLTATAQSTIHGNALLAFLIENTQVATEFQWTVFYTCHRNGLGSGNRHPI